MTGITIFNSPLEVGVRVLMLLAEAHPTAFDLQRLVVLDYLMVHSGDFDGPPSLHPPSPLRTGELAVRHALIQRGINLMMLKGLISRNIAESGITFDAQDSAGAFLDALQSQYSSKLRDAAAWAVGKAATLTDRAATALLESSTGRWEAEFIIESTEL